jgi:hypothetical protein
MDTHRRKGQAVKTRVRIVSKQHLCHFEYPLFFLEMSLQAWGFEGRAWA